MTQDMEQLTAAMATQTLSHSAEMQRREDHWSNECQKLQRLSETSVLRLQRLEADREMSQHGRRDSDILRIKNQELEEKIRRLEQQSKSRMLRDRTNTIQCPEISFSSDATPSVIKTTGLAPPVTSTATTSVSTPSLNSSAIKPMAPIGTMSTASSMPPPVPPMNSVYKPMPSASRFALSASSGMGSSSSGLHQPGCATGPTNHR
jgi:hypothetical protein